MMWLISNISSFFNGDAKPQGMSMFELYLVRNPKERSSRHWAQII